MNLKLSFNATVRTVRLAVAVALAFLLVAGCSNQVDGSDPVGLGSKESAEAESKQGTPSDDSSGFSPRSKALEIPPQLMPPSSSETISGFPAAELEAVSDLYKTLHESILLVNSDLAYGTAWLVRPDLAVTVQHGVALLSNPENVRMLSPDGELVWGRVVAQSETYDLALIELEGEFEAAPLQLSESSAQTDEPLFSIGHPGIYEGGYGRAWVTTVGLMAGFQEFRTSFIRTTIPTVGGQSGSPIFNLDGQVVGISGYCSSPTFGPGESLRAEPNDQISYFPPRPACGGADVAVLSWFLEQFDSGLQLENMPGWPDWREDEYSSLADQEFPPQYFDESTGTTVSGFPIEDLGRVSSLYEELRQSIVLMDIGDTFSKSGGTGWLVAPDLVLTNEHVLPRRGENLPIRVESYDGVSIDATEVARDSQLDIALIRLSESIDAEPLKMSTNSDNEGSPIFSIGHPSSLPRTWVTSVGVVASGGDPLVLFSTIPAVDGSSGSPIFNLDGEVIGIIWGSRGMPTAGMRVTPASPNLQLSYHPPTPITAASRAKEIARFLEQHVD